MVYSYGWNYTEAQAFAWKSKRCGHNFYVKGTNLYLSFVGKCIKTYSFISSSGSCTQICYPWMFRSSCTAGRASSSQHIDGLQIIHELYFINLNNVSVKIKQPIHSYCCRVDYNSNDQWRWACTEQNLAKHLISLNSTEDC